MFPPSSRTSLLGGAQSSVALFNLKTWQMGSSRALDSITVGVNRAFWEIVVFDLVLIMSCNESQIWTFNQTKQNGPLCWRDASDLPWWRDQRQVTGGRTKLLLSNGFVFRCHIQKASLKPIHYEILLWWSNSTKSPTFIFSKVCECVFFLLETITLWSWLNICMMPL